MPYASTPVSVVHVDPAQLARRTALVTGAGNGLGRAIAIALAGAGARVILVGRTGKTLAETANLIADEDKTRVAVCDVSSAEAVDGLRDSLAPEDVDLLVNNAGIGGPVGNAWDVPADAWWQTIEVNLGSAFLCTRLVLPGMAARGAGRIINVTSNAGVLRWPQSSAYAVSKAAMIKLTENVATEARRSGVGIFSIDPGLLPIGLSATAVAGTATPGSGEARRDAWIRQQLAAGRGAEPASVTRLMIRIAVGDADELSGCHLSVHDDLDTMLALARHRPERDLYRLRRYQPGGTAPTTGRTARPPGPVQPWLRDRSHPWRPAHMHDDTSRR